MICGSHFKLFSWSTHHCENTNLEHQEQMPLEVSRCKDTLVSLSVGRCLVAFQKAVIQAETQLTDNEK